MVCLLALLAPTFLLAQTSKFITANKAATINMSDDVLDLEPSLRHLEAPFPGNASYRSHLQTLKSGIVKSDEPLAVSSHKKATSKATVFRNFRANPWNGTPNDNHMAISKDGKIVSVTNSRMIIYSENGKELLRKSLKAIQDPLKIPDGSRSLPGSPFDPRVVYDPDEDKFILNFISGTTDSTSYLIFGFSKTNDPTGDWNLYVLPGNPYDDESWSDYPMMATTKDELFFTINLLRHRKPGETWKETFKQTIIWQIDKKSGYDGDTELKTKLYGDIEWDGKPIRNVCPVEGGTGNYGPNMYFLSNRNFDLENDTIFFIEVTGKMNDARTKTVIKALKTDQKYGLAPDADQNYGVLKLQTNDSRVLDAYLENDEVVFVGNSVNFENNWAGFYLGKVSSASSNPKVTGQIIGSDTMEFGYPGIAYTGDGKDRHEAIIVVNHTSGTHMPGCGVFFYDNSDLSNYQYVKEGETHIVVSSGEAQRWGDYIGIQRKFDEPGEVWIAATYGWKKANSQRIYGTWIGEIGSPQVASVKPPESTPSASVYPNPTSAEASVQFEVTQTTYASFQLMDAHGKLVQHIYRERVKSGKNEFSITTGALEPGFYFLQVTDAINGSVLVKEKILVQR